MRVCADGYVEGCFFEQRAPEVKAWAVIVKVSEDGDVTDEYVVFGLFEIFALEFLLEKCGLVETQLGEIVEASIYASVVGLILSAVEQHEARVSTREGGVGLVVVIADLVVHSSRIVVADFMVAAQEDDGAFSTIDGVGQGVNHV